VLAEQAAREVISGTGRQERESCVGIDGRRMNVEIVVELEEPFSRFAERSVTADNDNRLNAGSQRCTRLDRRVTGSFCFVGLILNAGRVELFLNGGPQAPRTGGAVVDDNELSRGHERD
jgi:hypothetical protein